MLLFPVYLISKIFPKSKNLYVFGSSQGYKFADNSKYLFLWTSENQKNIKSVDLVIPETNWEQKISDIKKHNIDIFAMGNDWKGKFDFLNQYCQVVYLDRTSRVSSSEIKSSLKVISTANKEDV